MNKINGMLLIDKPAGWTSHDVVAKIRKLLKVKKAGHTGTLDPDATGLLCICLGKATKLTEYLKDDDKEYRVIMRLGITTDTQDGTGRILREIKDFTISEDQIREAFHKFTGKITQIPPMYSAIKRGGIPLYKLARAGKEVEREPRTVEIKKVELINMATPFVEFRVTCSKGTYIRTLCADMGDYLGTGAIMWRLERIRCGNFSLSSALSMEEVERYSREKRIEQYLISMDEILPGMGSLVLNKGWEKRAIHGGYLPGRSIKYMAGKIDRNLPAKIKDMEERLIAIGIVETDISDLPASDRAIRIEKVLI